MKLVRGGPLKLITTLRGSGSLLASARRTPVTYQIELYRRGQAELASGEAAGEMSPRQAGALTATLRLETGQDVGVTIREMAADVASFDVNEAGVELCHTLASRPPVV